MAKLAMKFIDRNDDGELDPNEAYLAFDWVIGNITGEEKEEEEHTIAN